MNIKNVIIIIIRFITHMLPCQLKQANTDFHASMAGMVRQKLSSPPEMERVWLNRGIDSIEYPHHCH